MKRLCEKNIILKYIKTGNSWSYRLNPQYGYKGSITLKGKKMIKKLESGEIVFTDTLKKDSVD
jgi:hypothetical protein